MENWLTGIGTLVLAVVAVFQDKIHALITRPKLEVSIKTAPPYCLHIPWTWKGGSKGEQQEETDSYYIRLKIENTGNQHAESPEVFATELSERQADGTFKRVPSFLPMNLIWADFGTVDAPDVSPEMYRYCNIAHILDPGTRGRFCREDKTWNHVLADKTILSFDTYVKTNTLNHLVPFGTYRLHLLIGAANAKPIKCTLEITLTGEWFADESAMFRDGLGVRII